MAMPPPPVMALAGPLNPIEAIVTSLNTNTYLIGLSMILLNLGGRHLAMGLTPEQDRFFQNPWMRRGMLFVVIFVATRNVFTALWLSIGLVLTIGYLLNEHSGLYLFGEPVPLPPQLPPAPATPGLTGEEQEIYKRLHDKVHRTKSAEELKRGEEKAKEPLAKQLEGWYRQNMAAMRSLIAA
jgi:hypothetical protein